MLQAFFATLLAIFSIEWAKSVSCYFSLPHKVQDTYDRERRIAGMVLIFGTPSIFMAAALR